MVTAVRVPVGRHPHSDHREVRFRDGLRRARRAQHLRAQRRDVGREGRARVLDDLVRAERVLVLVEPDRAGAEPEAEAHVLALVRRCRARRRVVEHGTCTCASSNVNEKRVDCVWRERE